MGSFVAAKSSSSESSSSLLLSSLFASESSLWLEMMLGVLRGMIFLDLDFLEAGSFSDALLLRFFGVVGLVGLLAAVDLRAGPFEDSPWVWTAGICIVGAEGPAVPVLYAALLERLICLELDGIIGATGAWAGLGWPNVIDSTGFSNSGPSTPPPVPVIIISSCGC